MASSQGSPAAPLKAPDAALWRLRNQACLTRVEKSTFPLVTVSCFRGPKPVVQDVSGASTRCSSADFLVLLTGSGHPVSRRDLRHMS